MKNQDIKRHFFQNLEKGESALLVAFVKYTLSKLYSHCNFYYFFRDYDLFCNKKLFNIFLGLCIYFLQKPVKMILENHSLNLSEQHMIRSVI